MVEERNAKIFTVVGNGKGKCGKVRVEWESGGWKVVGGEGIWEGKGTHKEESGMGEGER